VQKKTNGHEIFAVDPSLQAGAGPYTPASLFHPLLTSPTVTAAAALCDCIQYIPDLDYSHRHWHHNTTKNITATAQCGSSVGVHIVLRVVRRRSRPADLITVCVRQRFSSLGSVCAGEQ